MLGDFPASTRVQYTARCGSVSVVAWLQYVCSYLGTTQLLVFCQRGASAFRGVMVRLKEVLKCA